MSTFDSSLFLINCLFVKHTLTDKHHHFVIGIYLSKKYILLFIFEITFWVKMLKASCMATWQPNKLHTVEKDDINIQVVPTG